MVRDQNTTVYSTRIKKTEYNRQNTSLRERKCEGCYNGLVTTIEVCIWFK